MPTYAYNRVSQRMMVADNTGLVFREMNDRELEVLAAQLTLLPVSLPAIEGIAATEKPLHLPVTQEQFQSALKEIRDKFALKSDVVNALKAAEELIYALHKLVRNELCKWPWNRRNTDWLDVIDGRSRSAMSDFQFRLELLRPRNTEEGIKP